MKNVLKLLLAAGLMGALAFTDGAMRSVETVTPISSVVREDSVCTTTKTRQGNKTTIINQCVVVVVDTVLQTRVDTVFKTDTVFRTDTVFKTDTIVKLVTDTVFKTDTVTRVDTVFVPATPDTTTPPKPLHSVALTATFDTVYSRPLRHYTHITVRVTDSLGNLVSDSVAFSTSDTTAANYYWLKATRRFEIGTPKKNTTITITGRFGSASATKNIVLILPDTTTPPTDTTTPPPPPTNVAQIFARIGPMQMATQTQTLGAPFSNFDPKFALTENTRWVADSTAGAPNSLWSAANYYDRAANYYLQWYRTGNADYLRKANLLAVDYRVNYLEANGYNASPHWYQGDGIALHYWLTGDAQTFKAIYETAHRVGGMIKHVGNVNDPCCNEGRIQARTLQALMLAYQVNAPVAPTMPSGWGNMLDSAVKLILPTQSPDGGWRYTVTCGFTLNYMNAMIAEMLIRVHALRPNSGIPNAVKKTADYLWATAWRAGDAIPSFDYYSGGSCPNSGGPGPTPDLTGIFVPLFTYMASVDSAGYYAKAVAVVDAANRGLYAGGSKQWNQWSHLVFGLGYLNPFLAVQPDTLGDPATYGVELPRSLPTVAPAYVETKACTTSPTTAAALQTAITTATGGTVICLTPGATYVGFFSFPARTDTGWVVLRTSGNRIPDGVRITPTTAAQLAKIVSNGVGSQAALTFQSKASRWYISEVEITSDASKATGPVALVLVGGNETQLSDVPTDVTFSQVYIHGYLTQGLRRAFAFNGGAGTVKDSHCSEIHEKGFDSQCWISWEGTGPFLIENNLLEAASENIMFGGANPNIPGVIPSDATIRRNLIRKNPVWMGQGWNSKNLIETKSSRRVLVEDNDLENSWIEGQTGQAFVIKTTEGGTTAGQCYWCETSHWVVRRNHVRNVGTAFQLSGKPQPAIVPMNKVLIVDNFIENVGVSPWTGDRRFLTYNADARDIWVVRNTMTGNISTAIVFDGQIPNVTNMGLIDNIFSRGQYGMFGGGVGEGTTALTIVSGIKTVTGNVFIGPTTVPYPATTVFVSDLASALATGKGTTLARIRPNGSFPTP